MVLITIGGILANGLTNAYSAVSDLMFQLNREKLRILGGPHGEVLDEDEVPEIDRMRLDQIRFEMPLVIRRIRRIRNAGIAFVSGVGFLVLSVIAIAVAVTAGSQAFGYAALALVLAGSVAEFVGVVLSVVMLVRSYDALLHEARRTDRLS
ncbi:MAG TPA: hypothetical protein VF060_22555 [Trebonia sp.]